MRLAPAIGIGVLLIAAGRARAHDQDPPAPTGRFVARTLARANALLDELAAARVPPLSPPKPIAVQWKARKLGSIDLGAPLLELVAGDLDGDGRAELVALTTRDVIVLGAHGARALTEVARIALPAELPAIEPRDPVGALAIAAAPPRVTRPADVAGTAASGEIWARSSTAGRGARYALAGANLREVGALAQFPWCAPAAGDPARAGDLVPGKDYFGGDGPLRVLAVRCRADLVDEAGRALIAVGALGPGGVLDVDLRARCAAGDRACPAERHVQVPGVGVAYAIADVDNDGRPEVIASGDGAPGDPDQISVYSIAPGTSAVGKFVYRKKFTGGVAGVVAADLDGDGDLEVVAAVRLAGAARVDLWILD